MLDYLSSMAFWWPTISAGDCGETAQLHELDAGWNNTVKHLQGFVQGEREARYAVEMATVVAGDAEALRRRPLLSDLIGTVSPLVQDEGGIEAALVFAEAGVPVCSSPCRPSARRRRRRRPAPSPSAPPSWSAPPCWCSSPTRARRWPALDHAELRRPAHRRHGELPAGRSLPLPRHRARPSLGRALRGRRLRHRRQGRRRLAGRRRGRHRTSCRPPGRAATSCRASACSTSTPRSTRVDLMLADDIYHRARYAVMDLDLGDESLALDAVREVGPGGHYLGTRAHASAPAQRVRAGDHPPACCHRRFSRPPRGGPRARRLDRRPPRARAAARRRRPNSRASWPPPTPSCGRACGPAAATTAPHRRTLPSRFLACPMCEWPSERLSGVGDRGSKPASPPPTPRSTPESPSRPQALVVAPRRVRGWLCEPVAEAQWPRMPARGGGAGRGVWARGL